MLKFTSVAVFLVVVSFISGNAGKIENTIEMEVSQSNLGEDLTQSIFQYLSNAVMRNKNISQFVLKKLKKTKKEYKWSVDVSEYIPVERSGIYADVRVNDEMVRIEATNLKPEPRMGSESSDDVAPLQRINFSN